MFQRFRKLGLQVFVLGLSSVLLLVGITVAVALVPRDVHETLARDLLDRGHSFVEAVAAQIAQTLHDGRAEAARATLARTHDETLQEELDAAVILLPDKSDPNLPDWDSSWAVVMSPPHEPHDDHAGRLSEARKAMREAFRLNKNALRDAPNGNLEADMTDNHVAMLRQVMPATTEGNERPLGFVLAVLDPADVEQRVGALRQKLLVTYVIFGVIFMVAVWLTTQMFVLRPLQRMRELATRISEGDLTGRVLQNGPDELGVTAESLNKIVESLNITLAKVKTVSEGVSGVVSNISHSSEVVSRGAGATQESVRDTTSSMEEMITSLKGIASNVEVLAEEAEKSSSSILQMDATNTEVAENIGALSGSVEETTTAIEQMTYSIREVAKNVEDLSASTEETSSSMNEMDVSIGQVEMNANETSKLGELVSSDAAVGVGALQKTLAGIEKIKDSSQTASNVIDSLGRKILTIGNILNVIDDVAEQTNLLALNAAIIAAQAGEHGKGFAVVADEIKDLAERTGASTKEIAELIKNVQDESRNAVTAMERGVKSVDEGVRLGLEAESALKKILESATKSSQMVKAIARATVEQSRGSKQVTNAINRIAETVQQIYKATAEQAKGSEQIMKSAERMKVITKHVERSSQEQARGSKTITKSIESINEMVTQLNRAQKEQTKGSENVLGAMENIKRVGDAQHATMRELERAVEQLSEQAEVLRSEVRRFRV
jgi:methyl-accepting chemotaxis protein